jgi:hypothetical protein
MLDKNIMQAAMQPYVKLVRSNLELLTTFSTSPEVTAQAAASAQSLLQQGQESAAGLMQSNAFAQLVQGTLKNYTEFLTEVGQVGKDMLVRGQAAMTRQVQETSERIVEVSKAGKRGVHQIG